MEPLSVLLVDDDVDFGAMMKLRLSREAPHISFHFAAGCMECLEYLKNNTVDCILSDFQMPVMNGMELMRSLKEKGMDVPFIFLTGQGNEEVARDAFKNGADDYFTKDMGFAHFARIINSVKQAVKKGRAEKAAARSNEMLKTVLDSVHFGMMVVGRDRTIRMANKAALDLMGYGDQSDIVGRTCHKAVCPAEAGKCPVWDLGMSLDLSERVLLKKDGERLSILKSASPIRLGEEDVLLETFVEVSGKKMAKTSH